MVPRLVVCPISDFGLLSSRSGSFLGSSVYSRALPRPQNSQHGRIVRIPGEVTSGLELVLWNQRSWCTACTANHGGPIALPRPPMCHFAAVCRVVCQIVTLLSWANGCTCGHCPALRLGRGRSTTWTNTWWINFRIWLCTLEPS